MNAKKKIKSLEVTSGFSENVEAKVLIFKGPYVDALAVRELLEVHAISVSASNDYVANQEPWLVSAGGFNLVCLQVELLHSEEARNIVQQYQQGKVSTSYNFR